MQLAAVAFVLAAQAPPVSPAPPQHKAATIERWDWSAASNGAVPIDTVEVRNDFGDIRARTSPEPLVECHAVMQRLGPAGADAGVVVARSGSVLTLTVTFPPGREPAPEPAAARDAFDRVDLTVRVPEGVRLVARTIRGMVEARKVRSDVDAATVAGDVVAITTGSVRVATDSGQVTAILLAAPKRPCLLESRSGAIEATLPEEPSLAVTIETGGAVTSEIDLGAERRGSRSRRSGLLGAGDGVLVLWSDRGDVRLRRAAHFGGVDGEP